MPTVINAKTYYRTSEACQKAGVSRSTFFRWLKEGILDDVLSKDRRGWRLFAESDIDRIKAEACKMRNAYDAAVLQSSKRGLELSSSEGLCRP